jgi:hypothetical protein
MTGKELKAFAANVPDEATILVRERAYGDFEARFEMQAVLQFSQFSSEGLTTPGQEE